MTGRMQDLKPMQAEINLKSIRQKFVRLWRIFTLHAICPGYIGGTFQHRDISIMNQITRIKMLQKFPVGADMIKMPMGAYNPVYFNFKPLGCCNDLCRIPPGIHHNSLPACLASQYERIHCERANNNSFKNHHLLLSNALQLTGKPCWYTFLAIIQEEIHEETECRSRKLYQLRALHIHLSGRFSF
jgi:hypothetical protein